MNIHTYNRPILFYGLSILIPWLCWFVAAYLSHNSNQTTWVSALEIVGLICPMVVAFALIFSNNALKKDFLNRIFNFKDIKPRYFVLTCFLMLGSILLAQAISLLFGHSADQFKLAGGASFSSGVLSAWALLFLAPLIEELAWHSYGTDCLRTRFSLFTTSLIFALFWGFWHFPLSYIKDYYHSNLAETGWLYSLNFFVSLFPFVFIMNWLYYKTNRNVLVAIVFHITAGLFNELFSTHPDSKVIQTVLLLIVTVFIVVKEQGFFFKKGYNLLNGYEIQF